MREPKNQMLGTMVPPLMQLSVKVFTKLHNSSFQKYKNFQLLKGHIPPQTPPCPRNGCWRATKLQTCSTRTRTHTCTRTRVRNCVPIPVPVPMVSNPYPYPYPWLADMSDPYPYPYPWSRTCTRTHMGLYPYPYPWVRTRTRTHTHSQVVPVPKATFTVQLKWARR